MAQFILVGLGAGAVAALTFAALVGGSPLSMLLFYLAPLPVIIAALGWSHWAGLLAALVGTAALAAWFGTLFFLVFLIGLALPGWWLAYLALLARPATAGNVPVPAAVTTAPAPDGTGATELAPAGPPLDWYPVGRLVLWAALLGATAVALSLPTFGDDVESIRATLKEGFSRVLRQRPIPGADGTVAVPGVSEPGPLIEFLAAALPPAAAVLMTMTLLFNLWLAGRAVSISGRLPRPWPVLSDTAFPASATVLLGAMVAGSFLPGLIGLIASLFAASLLVAFTALGFAVLHALTRRLKSRGLVLSVLYASVMLFAWPLFAVMLVGLTDTAIDLRRRFGGAPAAHSGDGS
ncbi:hypothetical protein RHODGE_RHODGE_01952 [Rhodoplanes serenus]|uniref:DUF2232 domain-containing protein n=1 Tax=Rhodoplanes serenus TaxID=200615 RepID=A0A3S4BFP3_9BRAD|nr:DUF2232 domain-containing protein [Rhodoplanes serenus]VCU08790.1 hypothetical protein RHODGE_RHODGE_01952 [Rhodoplanes serenus]